ncbi:CheR family methyltransferase [Desulfococcaceae bacterium HSG9]|nr:CheR family methyltransferase [Desulfococcaceae bacterium HSG9]
MDKLLTDQFKKIIVERTGLYLRTQDNEKLIQAVNRRTAILKLSSAHEYYCQLSDDSHSQSPEWQKFILMLTTAETFFFRHKGQFGLLRDHILPQILWKHRHDRTMRLWSAGCSTGEEPYSLAMLINELLPDWERWNILLLGTDINASAIAKAKTGIYGDWSFRMVDPDIKKRYFKYKSGWVIDRHIRAMVTFRTGNLRQDPFPDTASQIYDIDLILCRNVFIYFTFEAISAVVKKFCAALTDEGFLMTGYNELHGQNLHNLKARSFQTSTIYQQNNVTKSQMPGITSKAKSSQSVKIGQSGTALTAPPNNRFAPHVTGDFLITHSQSDKKPASEPQPSNNFTVSIETGLPEKADVRAIDKSAKVTPDDTADKIEALYLKAKSYANSGKLAKAITFCRQIMAMENSDINSCYLLACIMQEKGEPETAKKYLKRIIYFHPDYIAAYVELAALYEAEHDFKWAKKMWLTALNLLAQVSPDDLIAPYDQVRALTLTRHIQHLIGQMD